MADFNLKTLKLEGQLYKYTNVVKGFQIRYFVVNTSTSKLDYYMSEDAKSQKPRGSIELLSSIISPSEEDSNTFTINTPENEIFKLRAQDAKERQHWVNILRIVSQSNSQTDIKKLEVEEEEEEEEDEESDQDEMEKLDNKVMESNEKKIESDEKEPIQLSSTNKELIKEIYDHIMKSHAKLQSVINDLPEHNSDLCKYDADVLIIKSISSSCAQSLIDCCNILYTNKLQKSKPNSEQFVEKTLDKSDFNKPESSSSLKKSFINHDEEITDEESESITIDDYSQQFEDNKQEISKLLSDLQSGLDLTKTTLPCFLLEKKSLLEILADSMSHINLFLKISDELSPEDRFLAVIDWFFSSFSQIKKQKLSKKPYNPILGEIFNCSWKVNDNLVTYIAEQVSHHPSITSFYVECKSKKIKLNSCFLIQSVYEEMSISIKLIGELIIKLEKYNEEYHVTFPSFYVRSIATNPWIEICESCKITCPQTGLKSLVEFELKKTSDQKSNKVQCEVKNKQDETICKISGEWNGKLEYDFLNQAQNKRKTSLDLSSIKIIKKRVRPIDIQEENESRRVWYNVTESLKQSDFKSALNHKSIIEKQQRISDKLRKEKNLDYVSKNFFKTKTSSSSNDCVWLHKNF